MGNIVHHGPINADAAVAANEAAPTLVTHGIDASDGDLQECVWYLTGGTSCSATFFYYDSLAVAWCAGETVSVSGNAVLLQYTFGERVDLRITSLTGTYQRNYKLVSKGA